MSQKATVKSENNSVVPAAVSSLTQPNFTIGAVNDPLEYEADAVAERIMRMPDKPLLQRKCSCERDDEIHRKPISNSITPFIQAKGAEGGTANTGVTQKINETRGSGSGLDSGIRSFMESRFGNDLGGVKIHTDTQSVQLNRELNAQAFTVGNDIYFNEGKYSPGTDSGKFLLAHELTHVFQQGSAGNKGIQRTLNGNDNFGRFSLNERNCTFDYDQTWYFNFKVSISEAEKLRLMSEAANHVHRVWSNAFPLIPTNLFGITSCPCRTSGANVNVNIHTVEGRKTGRGIYVEVLPRVRANVNPSIDRMQLEYAGPGQHDFDENQFPNSRQYTVAHEFGHTIDITDEYNGWTGFFLPAIQKDESAIMNAGNTIHPRHYQPFGDMLSLLTPLCHYSPGGIREPDRENAVYRVATLGGLTLYQDGLTFSGPKTDFSMGTTFDRRVSNERLFGLFYPHIGAIRLMDPSTGNQSDYGLTAGLRLGQIAHPVVFNLRTGIVTNPISPERNISIPFNVQMGLRTSKYEFGLSYTLVQDLLNDRDTTHLFGVELATP